MRSLVSENIGFFVNDLLKGYSVRSHFNTFKKHLTLNQEQVNLVQLEKFQKLISHAYNHTSFYKNRLDEMHAKPEDFTSLELIREIPPLTRTDLQNNWKGIVSNLTSLDSLSKGSSSGSTGVPVVYFKDNQASSAGQAAGYICQSLAGWRLGMKGLHIWGNPTTVQNEWKRKSSRLKAWFFNHYKFPAYQLSDPNRLAGLAEYLQKDQFDFIDGYTNSIFVLAEYCNNNGIKLNNPLKMVLTTAENLQEYQRVVINTNLGPVFDLYGCSEINGIANECSICGKYHVMDTHVLLEYGEVLDDFGNRPLLITDLDNFAFPMIRYLNGDAGKPDSSANNCKIPLSRMESISGRLSDIITLPGGGTLSVPSFFGSMLLKKVKGIIQYQIEKDRFDHLLIRFVVNREFEKHDIEIINSSLDIYLADRISWDIVFVDDIPVSKTGKFKLVIDNS